MEKGPDPTKPGVGAFRLVRLSRAGRLEPADERRPRGRADLHVAAVRVLRIPNADRAAVRPRYFDTVAVICGPARLAPVPVGHAVTSSRALVIIDSDPDSSAAKFNR